MLAALDAGRLIHSYRGVRHLLLAGYRLAGTLPPGAGSDGSP